MLALLLQLPLLQLPLLALQLLLLLQWVLQQLLLLLRALARVVRPKALGLALAHPRPRTPRASPPATHRGTSPR